MIETLGEWYDSFWGGIFWCISIHAQPDSDTFLIREWREEFFDEINAGWLKMYPQSRPTKEDIIESIVYYNPYYNEKYYE